MRSGDRMLRSSALLLALLILAVPGRVVADDDIDLFDGRRQAVAYIASDADLTIYLWSGKPVAYLEGEDIYGFNGKHLGWFLHGVVYDPDGHIVAAVPEAFKSPVAPPPFKAFKQFRPF